MMDVSILEPTKVTQPIDIIVTAHGRLDLTAPCITAIYENTKAPFHLIVLDDSNIFTDPTPSYFDMLRLEHENLTYIHSDKPYTEGNQILNIGLQQGDSSYAVVVNNSVRVEPGWEETALEIMKENPKIGAVGFKCLFPNGLIESAGIGIMNFAPVDIGRDEAGHRRSVIYECEAVQWAFIMLRREAVGKLEEGIYNGFKGWDDIDNCFTLRKNGWRIFYCGLGAGYHIPRATRGTDLDDEIKTQKANHENSIIFYKRWGLWDKVRANVKAQSEIARRIDGQPWQNVKQQMRALERVK